VRASENDKEKAHGRREICKAPPRASDCRALRIRYLGVADERWFCFSQMRYLSDHELVVSAVRFKASRMNLDGADASIETFLAANPRCCEVDRHPAARSLLDVLAGFNIAEVSITYLDPYSPHRTIEPYYLSYVAVEACGRAVKQARGIGLARPP
jgi:hypothetical protein